MSILLLDRGLFKNPANWVTVASPDVNRPVSPFFMASAVPDGTMLVTNGLDQPWCGALVKNKRSVPIVNGAMLNYVAFHLKLQLPGITAQNIGRLETDLKVCTKSRPDPNTPIKNVANFSTQYNYSNHYWQIDPSGAWTNVIGANMDPPTADIWHTLNLRFWMDPVALVWSVLSIEWDNILFNVPSAQQRVSFFTTNWEQTANLQLQNEGFKAGSVEIQYDEGVLAWSDEPIETIPTGNAKTFADVVIELDADNSIGDKEISILDPERDEDETSSH